MKITFSGLEKFFSCGTGVYLQANTRASFANIQYLFVVVCVFLLKRADDDGAQSEIINDSEPSECKPQKPESPGKIHVQENAEVLQLHSTEISATDDDPNAVPVNETASGVVLPTRSTEPVAENLLRSSKVEVSRRESDFEPPPCNCPGIYIFFYLYSYSNARNQPA